MKNLTLYRKLFSPALSILSLCISSTVWASPPQDLRKSIAERREKVAEFVLIREAGQELGIRVWLFGGTASGFGHYVEWDLLREAGDTRYIPSRFDYDFTNIYRSTQDADLVIDGSVEDAVKLENLIGQKIPHLEGSKSKLEVRLLKTDRGVKQALLHNPDFLEQHSDSNSTGMIEITQPPAGESVVRDLRDWENEESPQFLRDLATGTIHYYQSPTHKSTTFYRQGVNPEIFSVIRFLTKAFQYDLKILPEDEAKIQTIINEFKPELALSNPVAMRRLDNPSETEPGLGQRLMMNASNLEYAWNELERLGLRKKLIALSTPTQLQSMAWWLNKAPLKTLPIGDPKTSEAFDHSRTEQAGRTLKQLAQDRGITWEDLVFAHDTSSFLAYEGITRDTTGRPNVLISRNQSAGEMAVYGNGFYTQIGTKGAAGTGLTIRFKASPESAQNAIEGRDFLVQGNYVIFRNRAVIQVIPESLNIGIVEYFEMISEGKVFDASEKGILMKLKRKMGNQIRLISEVEKSKLLSLIGENVIKFIASPKSLTLESLPLPLREWFSLEISAQYPEFVSQLIHAGKADPDIASYVLNQPHWKDHPELVTQLIQAGKADREIARLVLSQPRWKDHPEWVTQLIQAGHADQWIVNFVLFQPHWKNHPEWVIQLIQAGKADREIARFVLSQPDWKERPQWVTQLMQAGKADVWIAIYVLSQPHWKDHPEWVTQLIQAGKADREIAQYMLSQPHWKDHPQWVTQLIQAGKADMEIATYVLSQPHWKYHPEWVTQLIQAGKADRWIAQFVLSQPHWKDHPELVTQLIQAGKADQWIAQFVLSQPHWKDHPEWVIQLIQAGKADPVIARFVLSNPIWKDHPELRALSHGEPPTIEGIRKALSNKAVNAAKGCDAILSRRAGL